MSVTVQFHDLCLMVDELNDRNVTESSRFGSKADDESTVVPAAP